MLKNGDGHYLRTSTMENAYKSISEPQDFKIFMPPQTTLATWAFGNRNLPCLVLKSGYGPTMGPLQQGNV